MCLWLRRGHRAIEPIGGRGPFASVTRYVVTHAATQRSIELIRFAAADHDELFVAWAGTIDGEVARVTDIVVPRQRCIHTTSGMFVHIEGDALFKMNRDLHERGLLLIGQAHGHPTHAYHSQADVELAFATVPGAVSLVIPDWARDSGPTRHRCWYRRDGDERWQRLPAKAVAVE